MDEIITGIDIGTTKVCTLIAEVNERHKVRIIGIGNVPSKGLHKGTVVNIEEATQCIAQSVAEAERMSGQSVQSAYVSIANAQISSLNSRGATVVGRGDRRITETDVARAMEAAQAIAIPHNRQVLHAISRGFTLDGQEGIRDPIGMVGYRLEVEAHIVTATVTSVRNLINCIQAVEISPDGFVLQALASAEAVLRPEEKQMGVVLVDIGGGTTDLAVFIEGSVWHSLVLGVGGNNLTNDIAIILRTPFATAEELKTRYGHAVADAVDPQDRVNITTFGEGSQQSVPRRDLARIIAARSEEILDSILREIKRSGYDGLLPAGMVLTGGTAELEGFSELARNRLDLPVRIGTCQELSGLVAQINSPAYAAAVGLVLWGARYGRPAEKSPGGSLWRAIYERFKGWFEVFQTR